jgi:transcription elongation factor GreA
VIQAIAVARSNGDLSENADYDAARERQGFIEGRILEIENKLALAEVIDPKDHAKEGRVVFGAVVDVEDEDTEKKQSFQIVGDDEADVKLGKISVNSPVARALIGKKVGDEAEVHVPAGIRTYEILDVKF